MYIRGEFKNENLSESVDDYKARCKSLGGGTKMMMTGHSCIKFFFYILPTHVRPAANLNEWKQSGDIKKNCLGNKTQQHGIYKIRDYARYYFLKEK